MSRMKQVKMFWWNEQPNFGDALNPILLKHFFDIEAVWSPLSEARLVGAGSCLQWVASEVKAHPHEMHIWGTGYMYDKESPVASSMVKHHAVRGANSKLLGKLTDVVLGDPGILSSLLFEKQIGKKYRVGVVPHLWNQDDDVLTSIANHYSDVKIISVSDDPLIVLEDIASCDFIFSSSLHGLIVADSFGIPNQWVGLTKELFGGNWKFDDYYSVYNIKQQKMLKFSKQLIMQREIEKLINNFEPRNGIKEMQQSLIQAFPKNAF